MKHNISYKGKPLNFYLVTRLTLYNLNLPDFQRLLLHPPLVGFLYPPLVCSLYPPPSTSPTWGETVDLPSPEMFSAKRTKRQ